MVQLSPIESAVPVRRTATSLARRFYQICIAMVADSLAEANLTPLQMGVLAYLNKQTGEPGIDQAGLAARLGIDRNNTGVIVGELERRGLLERRVSDVDQRAKVLRLTTTGEKLYQKLLPANFAANERILAPLNPRERELLRDFLIRVIQGNAAYARPGAGRRKRNTSRSRADR
jgi:DNA-binding MarR family transcriptional regulator